MRKIDAHIYFDQSKTKINNLIKLKKSKNIEFIISPSPTVSSEPNKSKLMYFFQSYIFSNIYFHKLAKYISELFYDDNYNLKSFWKLFTGLKNYKKVLIPKNQFVFNNIKDIKFIKMWLWINPKKKYSMKDIRKYYNLDSTAGFKLHMYWHNLNKHDLQKIISLNKKSKPIYIIMNYSSLDDIMDVVIENYKTKFIFGYGGFPHYENFWRKFSRFDNVYIDTASLHLNPFHIRKIFKYFKKNRIIFSTDYPYNFQINKKFSYSKFEERFKKINFDNKKKEFYYKNMNKLLK